MSAPQQLLMDRLYYLFPPLQKTEWDQFKLEELLSLGERVPGTDREAVLQYFIKEAMEGSKTNEGEHLKLLFTHAAQQFLSSDSLEKAWSYEWDNFTEKIPVPLKELKKENNELSAKNNEDTNEVTFENLIFNFKGGSQFLKKKQMREANPDLLKGKKRIIDEPISVCDHRKLNPDSETVKNMSSHVGQAEAPSRITERPFSHLVLAAHWDSKYFKNHTFLGASDSAVPVQYMLRLMKNIQSLSQVAEALASLYEAAWRESMEEMRKNQTLEEEPKMEEYAIPGRTTLFATRTIEEIQEFLQPLLTPAHFTLLIEYYFAPYSGFETIFGQAGFFNNKDIRVWLDLVQHLPEISFVLFDGEEAYEEWKGYDNTYGSRHLAQSWANIKTENGCSKYDSIDLFLLLDLMGPAGTAFFNLFPTQSGLSYAALQETETLLRTAALEISVRLKNMTLEENAGDKENVPLLWRLLGAPHEMLTLNGIPKTIRNAAAGDLRDTYLYRELWKEARVLRRSKEDNATKVMRKERKSGLSDDEIDDAGRLQCANKMEQYRVFAVMNQNIFFSQREREKKTDRNAVEDDHKHWLQTGRVLHAIAMPSVSVAQGGG
ncbi:glutaminyl-peptide cyclotransferase [Angomonas deanei]|uniref:Peptidase family M28, putative n=1 Tax=Angomonas deanei TaxID=59799 RepID=A0A7G2CVT7_9TRYP|nr:glutaminyl-peptide cyclotransferase [Angomonas deanei]CAD2222432.1 Peptidase family M28, putative [Angomonas deanei]|eukprot:EPY25872.1 glutaminyl-peptide cyclotransferase [Angomonas deanei]